MNTSQASSPAPTRYDRLNRYGHEMDGRAPLEPGDDPEDGRYALCTKCGARENTDASVQVCPRATFVAKSVMDAAINSMAESLGATTGSGKVAKKVRKMYAKNVEKLAQQRTDSLYKTFEEHIRPKPTWIPTAAWKVIQRIVLVHYV